MKSQTALRIGDLTTTLIAAVLLGMPVMAQPSQQSGVQQQTGHILSAESHRSHSTTSLYNPSTGQWSNGGSNSIERDTEIQVGNLVYESPQIHKEIQVGKDYPVNIEADKHGVAKKIDVIAGEKKYTYRITGIREAKAN